MRIEKSFLANEIVDKVKDSTFVYLVDFNRITVKETAQLRSGLAKHGASFHVVKNSILNKVGENLQWPSFVQWLEGQTAIIFGGDNPSGVAKLLFAFAEEKEKLGVKGGMLDGKLYDVDSVEALSKLPDLPTLQATFLSLLLTPYRQLLYVMQGVPQSFLNVLKAKESKGN